MEWDAEYSLSIFHSLYCPLGLSQTSVASPRPRPYQPKHAHFLPDFFGFPSTHQ
ncbi:uncharacterized protein LOC128263511 [Drosophila gunungcola]|uniref:uncharacterized protein LOC128263511 n=1 Tax=Drosophila gunungcola TaxID=103775 RepID=UPI0022E65131|nr:uncharacterized protein LOC128263511 [Drosophila gunungcola]